MKKIVVTILFSLHFLFGIPIDDPSEWPGHLEGFGSKQRTKVIEDVLYAWPTPLEFYLRFIDKVKPVHIKGVYRQSFPVTQWTDGYFLSNEEAKQNYVMVEPNLIENRTAQQKNQSFYEFVQSYHDLPILTFSSIPNHLKRDVFLPIPLRCDETSKHLVGASIVMSQGNAKSHVYNDDEETIYCSFRGTTDFLLIEYSKNKKYIIDKPQGGYSTVNVERVDYVKYPNLRKIDMYIKVTLEPGDCLYVPYKWHKQSNSYSNEVGQSIALNIWFNHLHDHKPNCQPIPDHQATLDKYFFLDQEEDEDESNNEQSEKEKNHIEIDNEEKQNIIDHFHTYLEIFKSKNVTFRSFYRLLKKDHLLSQKEGIRGLKFPKSFTILVKELFDRLDVDKDKILSHDDFTIIQKKVDLLKLIEYLEYQTARIEDYIEDLIESLHHNETIHDFDHRKMEEIISARPFDEL